MERYLPAPLLALFGLLIATLGALCGIGGGLFATPLAHYGFRFSLRRAVAVSLAVVATTTASATVTELLHVDCRIYGWLVLVLTMSALVGNQIGFWLVPRIPVRALKGAFTLIFFVVGVQVLLGSSSQHLPSEAAWVFTDYVWVASLGVVAGILVPLLGIGGGLAMVPGLLLLLPEIGYLGTRATSMAVASIISARSLWMYFRRRELEQRTGGWLALGALFGAYLGVSLVHLAGVAATAQAMMGAILCLTALRFAWDVFRPSTE